MSAQRDTDSSQRRTVPDPAGSAALGFFGDLHQLVETELLEGRREVRERLPERGRAPVEHDTIAAEASKDKFA